MANMDFRTSQPSQQERKPSHIDDEEFGVLDDTILDTTSPHMSPDMKIRRESFADTASNFSPQEGTWSGFHFNTENAGVESPNNASHSYLHPRAQSFPNPSSSQNVGFSQQTTWPMNGTSGSCTPTAGFDHIVEFGGNRQGQFQPQSVHISQQPAFDGLPLTTTSVFQPNAPFSSSPQSAKGDWVSGSSSEGLEFRQIPSNTRPHSPTFASGTSLLRRDGIRKKNARFEIPAERNLRTIDQLINQTNDEAEIKELKQQKRLLRNRQAALDSRQRKKQHTERLEEEKKHYTAVISELEEALSELRVQEAEWVRTKEAFTTSQQQYQQFIDALVLEKEELVRRHTIETGELRKKNAILVEQMQRIESTAMSTAPSSAGFSADFSDFDHLTMNSWDDFSMANDFSIEAEPRPGTALVVAPKQEVHASTQDDKGVTSGFLLMLLLCGAWVASRTSTSNGNILPQIPDDMRAASASVLDNIYKDSGIQLQDGPPSRQQFPSTNKPNAAAQSHKTTLSAYEIASLSSPLDALHHRLTSPTEQQLREQAFSLTPSQYNHISDGSYPASSSFEHHGRRNIGEVLAAVQSGGDSTVAETYTRSLMRDRVSTQVLKDFARMVAESNGPRNQWKSEPLS